MTTIMRTIKVEFIGKGFKRVRLQPADEKGTLMGERIDFVFGEAFKKVGLRVTDVDTGEELYNNKEFEVNPFSLMRSMDEAANDLDDDDWAYRRYMRLLDSEWPEGEDAEAPVLKAYQQAFDAMRSNESGRDIFIITLMQKALQATGCKQAMLAGREMSEEVKVDFFIELESGVGFDPRLLEYIYTEPDWFDEDNYSKVLDILAIETVSLNVINYDDRMYFAGPDQMFIPRHSEEHTILGVVNEDMKNVDVKPHDA
jgi:hypothetical protein